LKLNSIIEKNPTKIQQNWSHMKTNLTTPFIQLLWTEKIKNKIKNKYNVKKKHKKEKKTKSYLNLIVSEVEKIKEKTNL